MTFYAFKSDAKVNPVTGEGSDYFNRSEDQVVIVVRNSDDKGALRVITSFGTPEGADRLDSFHSVYWQFAGSNDRRGQVRVVGFVDAQGNVTGEVPSKMFPQWVMK